MEADRIESNSRIYSSARMKRRANRNNAVLPDSDAQVNIKRRQSVKYKDLEEMGDELFANFRKKSVFDANAENIRPRGLQETPSKSYTAQKLSTSKLESHTNSKQLHVYSGSSCESDSSRPPEYVHSTTMDTQEDRQKLKILGSLLPDEVLRDPVSTNCRTHQTALMFPDVSGFTQLCQKYDKTGKGGPSRLTAVLNGYIGSMIKIVLSRNGDVCKFGGDAFLCMWKVTEDTDLAEIVHLAIESAIDIQKNCGEHKTDVGVKLRVKIAVAAGNAVFSIIGTKTRKHYVIVGTPILDVRQAEQLCRPGDVIVSPSAWKYVKNYMIYSFTYHSDSRHIKVHDFGPLWKSRKTSKTKGLMPSGARPFLKSTFPLKIQDLRPFILPPVMRSIDLGQSLDYLTEMRQVAIVFFNITADFENMDEEDIVNLSNKAFVKVSSIVAEFGGGTNKLTLFDKDMAILTVFGLKGFKHAIASQVALKCAYKVLEQLKKLKLKTASAGVTTGMAYCGVIGHAMRKEYTVMGHPVNMSARLMCAYQNIVSCDRSTFLHSKLESGYFEVLQMEYMKGIQNAGPFYKFNIRPKRTRLKLDHEAQPLLGRIKEVEHFENFLEFGLKPRSTIHFFIIYGTARIGKSRLVARLVNITQKGISEQVAKNDFTHREIHLIALTEDDAKVAYSTIRLLFQPLLGLGDSTSVEEREDKILLKLGNIKEFSYLAAFNQIFNVNFDLSPQFLSLDHTNQVNARMVWLQNLYEKCFLNEGKWLIVIDDAEFMDEESWRFLTWCSLESNKALYLLTIGQKKVLSEVATSCLNLIKAQRITLSEIDKWYYLGLACQILGVKAIPMELENLLENYKSSGNPGWLESFLLSLLQSKCIYISKVTRRKMKSLSLVAPPEFMLTTKVFENKEREDFYWVDCLETFEPVTDLQQDNIRVCLLTPDFRVANEVEGELTMDVMFIKTIDTLEPLAQLVLKAGSVLGNYLVRNALEFLILSEAPVEKRQLAKAIKSLFEIKILTCAKGDLTQANLLVPKRMTLGTSIRNEVTCECTGLIIPETCLDLPKYANCGYMQFSFPTFRETLYNLLLDDQKKSFHFASLDFLRSNIHRCKSCNNELFKKILGYEQDDEVKLACTVTPMHGVRSTKLNPKSNIPTESNRKLRLLSFKNSDHYNLILENRPSDYELSTVGMTDMGDCQCSQILSAVYSVLLEHATGSGRKDLMLEVLLEYASVSLTMYNIPLTMQILEQALALVNQMKEEKEFPELYSPYIYSKVYTLMGATKLSMGRLDESLELLQTSLKYMKKTFPKSEVSAKVLTVKETITLRIATEQMPGNFVGKTSQKKAAFTDLLSECLGLMSVVYMYMKNLKFAKYASLWSLNKALGSNRNLYGLCTAYANHIEVSYRLNDLKTCSKLEVLAIDVCRKSCFARIEIFEWEAIGRLYKVIFQTRHVRAEIEEAVHIGFQSIKIASVINSTYLKLDLIPDLIFALIQMNRLSEAVSLLQELEFISRLDSDKSSRLWYYAISLDFQLYTGFTVVTYDACEEYVNSEDSILIRDPHAKYRLYTSMWLWCVRHAEWESIKTYGKLLKSTNITENRITPATVFTLLERLEGFLIMLVYKMDSRNIQSINPIFADIHILMHRLDNNIKVLKVFKPRYLLLKSYYRQIRFRDNSYYRILNKAYTSAEKMKDKNTSQWITHLKMLWSNAISQIQRDSWNEHSKINVIEWHESHQESKKPIISYSLPLPKF